RLARVGGRGLGARRASRALDGGRHRARLRPDPGRRRDAPPGRRPRLSRFSAGRRAARPGPPLHVPGDPLLPPRGRRARHPCRVDAGGERLRPQAGSARGVEALALRRHPRRLPVRARRRFDPHGTQSLRDRGAPRGRGGALGAPALVHAVVLPTRPARASAFVAPAGWRSGARPRDAVTVAEFVATRSRAADLLDLTKPRLSLLVVLSCAVGMALAPVPSPGWARALAAIAATGAVVGGANALNCYRERESDKWMRRTRTRPLPSGRLEPGLALAFGLALSVAGIAGLTLLRPLSGA